LAKSPISLIIAEGCCHAGPRNCRLALLENRIDMGGAMQRKSAALIGILLMLGALVVPAALASVPKVMIIEEYGATW
jgi:hypothetical protein